MPGLARLSLVQGPQETAQQFEKAIQNCACTHCRLIRLASCQPAIGPLESRDEQRCAGPALRLGANRSDAFGLDLDPAIELYRPPRPRVIWSRNRLNFSCSSASGMIRTASSNSATASCCRPGIWTNAHASAYRASGISGRSRTVV
jgi:hypothetical protein